VQGSIPVDAQPDGKELSAKSVRAPPPPPLHLTLTPSFPIACLYVARCDGCLHGVCVAPSRCTCDSGWQGTNCDKQPKKESSSWGIRTADLSSIPLTYPLSTCTRDYICCAGGCGCLRLRCNNCSRNSGMVLLEKETPPRRLWACAVPRVGARWEPRRVIYQGSLTVTVCLQCFLVLL